MTIKGLLAMPMGEKIGGGFILTVKTTKKSVKLPNQRYIHTVILFDNTGEMLADFLDPTIGKYLPLIKGQQYHIIAAEIQAADPTKKEAKKLYVDQYEQVKGSSELDYFDTKAFDELPDWETIVRGKIRHGIVCSLIQAKEIALEPITSKSKKLINDMVNFIMTGE